MLWCDKYRPTSLDQLTYNNDTTNLLKKMACDSVESHGQHRARAGRSRT